MLLAFEQSLATRRTQDLVGRLCAALWVIILLANFWWPSFWYFPIQIGWLFGTLSMLAWGSEVAKAGGGLATGRRIYHLLAVPGSVAVGLLMGALVLVWPAVWGLSWRI